jgi:hypothetical protein
MQLTVNDRMPVASPGLMAHPFDPNKVATKAAQGGSIPFGRAVVQGTAFVQCKLPTADTQKVIGVVASTHAVQSSVGTGEAGVKEKDPANVLNFGEIWMKYAGTAPGNDVPLYVVASGADAGKVTATAAGAITVPFKSRFSDTASGLVLVAITQSL